MATAEQDTMWPAGLRMLFDIIYIMRGVRADPVFGWVRSVLPSALYWRAWIGLARMCIALGFPLAWVGWLLSNEGPAVAGARRLYSSRARGRHAA